MWRPIYRATRPLVRKYNDYRIRQVAESELIAQQKNLFWEAGLDWASAHQKVIDLVGPHADFKSHRSQHYELFVAIAQLKSPKKVLEIGTADASFTLFLAQIFPNSEIVTVDLPVDDHRFWNATSKEAGSDVAKVFRDEFQSPELNIRNKNLSSSPNIVFREMNSLELTQFDAEEYDIIWVDGDHTYPVVACDITNAIRLLAPDGFVCCDDIRLAGGQQEKWGSRESLMTLNAFNKAKVIKTNYVLKSIRPEKNFSVRLKKHIAISKLADNKNI